MYFVLHFARVRSSPFVSQNTCSYDRKSLLIQVFFLVLVALVLVLPIDGFVKLTTDENIVGKT